MHVLALNLSWDPEIRGILIVLVAFFVLAGSVLLLLTTNLGSRLGFLVAAACLTGWLMLLGFIWTVYGLGDKGPDPTWKPIAVVTGDLGRTALPVMSGFPTGWTSVPEGNPKRAEAQATVDQTVVSDTSATQFGFTKFASTAGYLPQSAYEKGGQRHELFGVTIFGKGLTYKHDPHYAVIQVQPTVTQTTQPGQAPPTPKADTSKPTTTVLLERDLGSKRLPSFLIFISSGLMFGLIVSSLHRRDKAAMAARALAPARAG